MRSVFLAFPLLFSLVTACGSSSDSKLGPPLSGGASSGTGGASEETGGSSSGDPGTAGGTSAGGSSTTGGTSSGGAGSNTGGTNSGGSSITGGTSSGGSRPAGGSATGGTATGGTRSSTGGTNSGGSSATGGTSSGGTRTTTGGTGTGGSSTTGSTSSGGAGSNTGGANSGGVSTGGVIGTGGTSSGGAVACSTPLADRVRITPIAVSPNVTTKGSGINSATRPVVLSTAPNGTARVAWSDGTNVHVTPLDTNDQRAGADVTVTGTEVRGLVAHDDGAALIVVRGDAMVFLRLDQAGAEQSTLALVGNNAHTTDGDRWIDSWPHQGRLAWSGSQYAAYFGQTGNFGSQGNHQGDHYSFISPAGALMSGGWDWGCSHSLDVRLAHNGTTFCNLCTSDTYPGAGIWFNNRVSVSTEPSITSTGGVTQLGGLVPATDGFWLSFISPVDRTAADVAFVHISNTGAPSGRTYLTDTPDVAEKYAHLAAYGDRLLVGWSTTAEITLATIDQAGTVVEGPAVTTAQAGGQDDFATYPNGDVGWAYAWGSLANLQIVRVVACQ